MRKILSIDFDIIMAPSIELYNDSTTKGWEFLESFPQMQSLKLDAEHYKRLTQLVYLLFTRLPKEKIQFIEDHGRIVHYINQSQEPFHLINIDHHHDVGYHPDEEDEPLNCGNWVRMLQPTMLSYTWVGNRNSHYPEKKEYQTFITDKNVLEEFDLNSLLDIDELYLCLSEPWVPSYFRPLFFSWLDFAVMTHEGYEFEIDYTRCAD